MNGKRAGEKIYEELLTDDEAMNASETEDMLIVTQLAEGREDKKIPTREYRSDKTPLLTGEEIKEMLREIWH